MFSYEKRIKAVKLLIKYDMSYSSVIRELGYPDRSSLADWYKEYLKEGDLHRNFIKQEKYSVEEKHKAVNYYIEHGKSTSRTVRKLGYPSRPTLDKWILELAPVEKRYCFSDVTKIKYTREQKEQAVISLCSRSKPAKEVAAEHGITRECLYNWKNQLLKKEHVYSIDKDKDNISEDNDSIDEEVLELSAKKKDLSIQLIELQKEVHHLKIERDIYEKAAEIIKKDPGINIKTLTNREKAIIINSLRKNYQLKELLIVIHMAKSSYCYQAIAMNKDKYAGLKEKVKDIFK